MGVVFEAGLELPGGAEKQVALKWLHPELRHNAAMLRRFEQEARLHGTLPLHENLVTLHLFEHNQAGPPFMVLEYVDGVNLEEIAAASWPLSDPIIRTIVYEALEAIGHLHGRDVIHRDLSPRNLMISIEGCTKLVDLGLARPVDAGVSQPGFKGTPAYASPESLAGAGDALGPSADLYSLAAVTYRLLTGQPPFGYGEATEIAERMRGWELPPLPSETPDDLREFVMGLLRREIDDRVYQSAREAMAALDVHNGILATKIDLATLVFEARQKAPVPEPMHDIIDNAAIIEMAGPGAHAAAPAPPLDQPQASASPPSESQTPTRRRAPGRVRAAGLALGLALTGAVAAWAMYLLTGQRALRADHHVPATMSSVPAAHAPTQLSPSTAPAPDHDLGALAPSAHDASLHVSRDRSPTPLDATPPVAKASTTDTPHRRARRAFRTVLPEPNHARGEQRATARASEINVLHGKWREFGRTLRAPY